MVTCIFCVYSLFQALVNSECIFSSNSFVGEGSAFDGFRDDMCACATRICNKTITNFFIFFYPSVFPHVAIRESPKRL
jgi:hypothetical protein